MSHAMKATPRDLTALYLEIILNTPHMLYWLDRNCNLQGCNNHFLDVMSLKKFSDCLGMSYVEMGRAANWSEAQIMNFYQKDKATLLSGKNSFNVIEQPVPDRYGNPVYYQATRIALHNHGGIGISGVAVILIDITQKKTHKQPLNDKRTLPDLSKGSLPKILLIEDSLVAQKAAKHLFAKLNCMLDIASQEEEALTLFKPQKYDLVLMDIGLENTSGYIIAKKLRKLEKQANSNHTTIIALTMYDPEVIKEDCYTYGMNGVIQKPITMEQASQIILRYFFNEDVVVKGLI